MSQPPSPRRALLVIDVQNEYFAGGGLPITHPPVSTSLPNIAKAIDAARATEVPVIVVQHTLPAAAPVFAAATPTWQLHPDIAQRPADLHLEKQRPSVFTGTALAAWLDARHIDTLVVTGYMTHNCVASTVFEAFHRGYAVEVLSDATGALAYQNDAGAVTSEEVHRVFNVVFQSNFAAVASTSAWIDALRSGLPLARDNIPASHQRATRP